MRRGGGDAVEMDSTPYKLVFTLETTELELQYNQTVTLPQYKILISPM